MSDIECPYCGHGYDHDEYDFVQDETWTEECPKCEKRFRVTGEWDPCFYERRADCLNGGEHDYQPVQSCFYPDWVRCSMCDHDIKGKEEDS
jgi:DNA-directed RNA polymerase subunit RPC12/RpoP